MLKDSRKCWFEVKKMNKDEMEYQKWVYCPVCGNKTRVRLRKDTVLLHFPLFCPKCKKESLIDAEGYSQADRMQKYAKEAASGKSCR